MRQDHMGLELDKFCGEAGQAVNKALGGAKLYR
jgi:hypothetical protein